MDIEDPVIVDIARRLDVHPAVVCVKWAVQRGPDADSVFHQLAPTTLSNLQSRVVADPLTDEEMQAIAGIDRTAA